ncbi:MAG TPA: DNA alkylation repair protein [Vicinamibacterales bacterium]|nr:DNA alkylation repair protein [Vicinamibacterales bacterium]
MQPKRSVPSVAQAIVRHLKAHGSPEHAAGVQRYFSEPVRSYGWYAADLRRYAKTLHARLAADPALLIDVAERLFAGAVLEEKALAVTMLEPSLKRFGGAEFARFERWLGKVRSWADHDALTMCLIGPMMVAEPARAKRPLRWAASPNRWRRRAAAVSLIHGIRRGRFYREATTVTARLVDDRDDMVQKGLGWLLREWAKHDPKAALPVLIDIRPRASRLVLRTGCEKLSPAQRAVVLGRLRALRQ